MNAMQKLPATMRAAGFVASALLFGVTACAAAPKAPGAAPAKAALQQNTMPPKTVAAPSALAGPGLRIEVSFKLDPRLSGGTYGGEHWVSPATFSSAAQAGTEASVEARISAVDSRGAPVTIAPSWNAEDPSMLVVSPISPGETDHVQITMKRVGETKLVFTASGATKELRVKAVALANGRGIQVTITQ